MKAVTGRGRRRWSDDLLRLLEDETDHLGVADFAAHHLPLDEAPDACATIRGKRDGMVKVVFTT